jgi:nucleoid DNA-binding protein
LTEKFLIKNSLEMHDTTDLSFPTIKINIVAVSKLAEIEKQASEIIIDNIFEEIKKIIAENPKDLLIDLSQFGKLRIKDRKVIHEPNEKPKQSNISTFKKTTIKSLMHKDHPKKLPSLDESSERKLEPTSFNDSFSKYQPQQSQTLTKSKLFLEKPS